MVRRMAHDAGLRTDAEEIRDMTQDLYLRWLRRGRGFSGTTRAEFWLFVRTSTRRLAIDRRRTLKAVKRGGGQEVERLASAEEWEDEGHFVLSNDSSPETRLLDRERHRRRLRRFRLAARSVAPRDPRVVRALVWGVLEGRSSREVSDLFATRGESLSHRQIDRWVARLRRLLKSQGLCLPRRSLEPVGAWGPLPLPAPLAEVGPVP